MNYAAAIFLTLALSASGLRAADILLPAKAAKLEGAGALYDDAPASKSIRHWKNTNITARWTFDVPAKAAYRIFITYSSPSGSAGSEIEVTVGTQRATGTVQTTDGWGRYKEFDLGPVILRKTGPVEIVVTITRIAGGPAWDLRSVRLVPEN